MAWQGAHPAPHIPNADLAIPSLPTEFDPKPSALTHLAAEGCAQAEARSGRRFVMGVTPGKGAIVSSRRGRIAHAGSGLNFYSESHGQKLFCEKALRRR